VHGFLFEKHAEALMKNDLVVAHPQGDARDNKRVFLRVTKILSAPKSARTMTKEVSELHTRLVLEPLREANDTGPLQLVRNADLDEFHLRHPTQEELTELHRLPTRGWPLGRLDRAPNILMNLPADPADAIFRSMFVVGAKGKGKTSFTRELVTLLTSYKDEPRERRPTIVILDGEPCQVNDRDLDGACEFNARALKGSLATLATQLPPDLLDDVVIREVRVRPRGSQLKFRCADIELKDVPFLLALRQVWWKHGVV